MGNTPRCGLRREHRGTPHERSGELGQAGSRRAYNQGEDVRLCPRPGGLITAADFAFIIGTRRALPGYARQTGQPCAACHTAFPELTPFGRRFKIGGYTLRAATEASRSRRCLCATSPIRNRRRMRRRRPDCTPTTIWSPSRFPALSPAGSTAISDRSSRSPATPVARNRVLDASDVRYADTFKLFGQDTIWGIDANNPRPSKTPGTRPPPGAGRRSPRPSRRLSVRR